MVIWVRNCKIHKRNCVAKCPDDGKQAIGAHDFQSCFPAHKSKLHFPIMKTKPTCKCGYINHLLKLSSLVSTFKELINLPQRYKCSPSPANESYDAASTVNSIKLSSITISYRGLLIFDEDVIKCIISG